DTTLAVALPTDRPRPTMPTFEGGKRTVVFPLELLERLRQLARANDATLFMVLLAGFEALLHRYTGQDDLVVGTIVAGRGRAEPQYRSALFDAATIDRMLGHLAMVLDGASRAPDARVSALPLVTEQERAQLLGEWNGREVEYPRDAAVHELVAAQAQRAPDAIAISNTAG